MYTMGKYLIVFICTRNPIISLCTALAKLLSPFCSVVVFYLKFVAKVL